MMPSILLAEDNKANQIISKAMIESSGFEVTIAENGQEVLDLLSQVTFDLILLDCQMPIMDGYEAIGRIRQLDDPAKAGIPVVALTADTQTETRKACLDSGMDDFLTKPFTIDEIAGLVSK